MCIDDTSMLSLTIHRYELIDRLFTKIVYLRLIKRGVATINILAYINEIHTILKVRLVEISKARAPIRPGSVETREYFYFLQRVAPTGKKEILFHSYLGLAN